MIRVKLALKYEDEWRLRVIYNSCLRDAIVELKSGLRVKVASNKILLFLKGNKASRVAERLKNILGLIHTVERAIIILEAQTASS